MSNLALREAFLSQRVSALKPRTAHCLPVTASVYDAVRFFASAKVGSILVLDDSDSIKGIFTERDLVKKYSASRKLRDIPLIEFMSAPVQQVRRTASIARLLHIFTRHGIRYVAVVPERNSIAQVLSTRDIVDFVYHSITSAKAMADPAAAAGASEVHRFFNVPVSAVPSHPPTLLAESCTVYQAIEAMRSNSGGVVLVTDKDALLVGLFGERDLVLRVLARDLDPQLVKLGEVMTAQPTFLHDTAAMSQAFNLVAIKGFRHIPILSADNKILSVLSLTGMISLISDNS